MSEAVPGQPAIVDQVAVAFSPQQFKSLVRAMTETLKAFENSFGELTIPDADTRPMKSAEEISKNITDAKKKAAEMQSNLSSSEPPQPSEQSSSSRRKKGHQP